jgi:predicted HTH transcriptional regulator
VLKSVAAFANAQGGTLLIGVRDDGVALGLEPDMTSLDGDHDKLELHLRNLLNQAFGPSFVASKLRISFPSVGAMQICRLDVGPAHEPIILKVVDKNGQQGEKFFVRSGNSSVEMPISEMHAYVSELFAK